MSLHGEAARISSGAVKTSAPPVLQRWGVRQSGPVTWDHNGTAFGSTVHRSSDIRQRVARFAGRDLGDGDATVVRSPTPGHDLTRIRVEPPGLQPRLEVSEPDDPSELEADAIAEQVMGVSEPPEIHAGRRFNQGEGVSRCEGGGCQEEDVPIPRAAQADAHTRTADAALSPPALSGGVPLPESVRGFYEPRFGHDFAGVRIHTGDQDDHAAGSYGALAYTLGSHIVFGAGRYQPHTAEGRSLLAHELTHVVQQGSASSLAAPTTLMRTISERMERGGPADELTSDESVAGALEEEEVDRGGGISIHAFSRPRIQRYLKRFA